MALLLWASLPKSSSHTEANAALTPGVGSWGENGPSLQPVGPQDRYLGKVIFSGCAKPASPARLNLNQRKTGLNYSGGKREKNSCFGSCSDLVKPVYICVYAGFASINPWITACVYK